MNVKDKIPKTVKLKTYIVTLMLISVIFAGILNYSLSAYVGDVSEVWVQPPFHEASYAVGVYNSTYYYAKNGTTGEYEWKNTAAHTVTNNAINSLTHTYKEKIVFIGNLTFTSSIQLQNFTVLDLYNAQLNLGANDNLIETVNDNNVHSVEIHGGVLCGWDYAGDAIHINATQDLIPSWRNIISDVTITYFDGDGLSLYGDGGRSLVSNLYIYNCTRGVYANTPDNKFTSVVVGDSGHEAWYVSGGSNVITGGKGYGSGKDDTNQGSGIVFYGHNIHVIGTIFQENNKYGAEIKSTSYAISMTGCIFDRNSLETANTYDGVYVAGDNVTITGGEVKNMEGKSLKQRHGVYIDSTANNVKVFGVVEHKLLGNYTVTIAGATNVLIDDEITGSQGAQGVVYGLDFSYLIFKNATATYMVNGTTGYIDWNNANPVNVFEASFGNLTSGRTWKEKVVIRGNFSGILDTINLESYLELEIQGIIQLNDSQNQNLFSTTSKEHIEVHGGIIDPNGAGQSSTTHGLLFTTCSDISIHHSVIKGGYGTSGSGDSVRFADVNFSSVHDNYFEKYSVSYDDVKIRGTSSQYNIVSNNVFNATAGGYSAPVQISNGATRNEVSVNLMYVDGGSASAIKLHDADDNLIADNKIYMNTDVYGCIDIIEDGERNVIFGNQIYGAEHGIWFRETATNTPQWNKISNNYIVLRDWDGAVGIELDDNDNTIVSGNTIICTGTTGTQKGIFIESDCTDTLIEINYFDSQLTTTVDNDAGSETYIVNGTVTGGYEISFP